MENETTKTQAEKAFTAYEENGDSLSLAEGFEQYFGDTYALYEDGSLIANLGGDVELFADGKDAARDGMEGCDVEDLPKSDFKDLCSHFFA